MPSIYLTDSFVDNIKCSSDKDQEIFWDAPRGLDGRIKKGAVEGLGLRVTANGSKSYVHTFLVNGHRRRITIGKASVINVGSARLKVRQYEVDLLEGINPYVDHTSRSNSHALTVKELANQYWKEHFTDKTEKHCHKYRRFVAPWISIKKTTESNRRGLNKQVSDIRFGEMFGNVVFEQIKPVDVQAYLSQYKSVCSYNSAFSLVKALFNWAIRMQLVDMRNPCDPFKKKKLIRTKRDYTPSDIKAISGHIFSPSLETMPALVEDGLKRRDLALKQGHITSRNDAMLELCHFMGILFLTMARPTELKNAEFQHFDLEQLIWHKHNTKGIKLSKAIYEYAYRSVPIHPKVAEIVKAQRERWPTARLVFPSHTDHTQPRDNFRKPFERFRQLEGVPEYFQMYDLKRIAISLMLVGQGVRREDVSHYVDHKGNLATTMIYDLGFVDPLRPVSDRLGQLLGV